jgi:hypothetical protein
MYGDEAQLIEVLNEVDPLWREDFGTPQEAAEVLLPNYDPEDPFGLGSELDFS